MSPGAIVIGFLINLVLFAGNAAIWFTATKPSGITVAAVIICGAVTLIYGVLLIKKI